MSYTMKKPVFAAITDGTYNMEIIEASEIGGEFPHFLLRMKVLEGEFKNRIIFHRLWFNSETEGLADKLMSLAIQCFGADIVDGVLEAESFQNHIGEVTLNQYGYIDKDGKKQTNSRVARYLLP